VASVKKQTSLLSGVCSRSGHPRCGGRESKSSVPLRVRRNGRFYLPPMRASPRMGRPRTRHDAKRDQRLDILRHLAGHHDRVDHCGERPAEKSSPNFCIGDFQNTLYAYSKTTFRNSGRGSRRYRTSGNESVAFFKASVPTCV
jgi:hypothetical protein